MTLEEKIGQMGQINLHVMMGDPTTPWDRAAFNAALMDDVLNQNRIGSILSGGGAWPPPPGNDARDWAETVNEVQRYALEQPSNRLDIPIIYGVDAVHGHNNLSDATMVPHQIGLGATFDPPLAERLGASTARQVRATGIPWDFAPVLDTQRDHRWGRSYEPFGEDPFLNGVLGSSTIAGMRGARPDLAALRRRDRQALPRLLGARQRPRPHRRDDLRAPSCATSTCRRSPARSTTAWRP